MIAVNVICVRRIAPAILSAIISVPPSWAALMTTQSAGFSISVPVPDTDPPAGPTTFPLLPVNRSFSDFNPDLGVLLGTTLRVDSRMTGFLSLEGSVGTESATGVGTTIGSVAVPGAFLPVTPLVAQASCRSLGGPIPLGCSGFDASLADFQGSAAVLPAPGVLDQYVGRTGTVDATVSGVAQANATEDGFGVASALWAWSWIGGIALDYTYTLHAAPSLISVSSGGVSEGPVLSFNFGTYYQTSDRTESFFFDIFNSRGDRVALDLDSVVGTGDVRTLFSDVNTFTGLAPGGVYRTFADMDLSSPGTFSATYTLLFSDADVGAPTSRQNSTLTLFLKGQVVPEPGTLALLGLGLAGLAALRRRMQ